MRIEWDMLDSTGKELVGMRNATQNNRDNSTSLDPVALMFCLILVSITPTPKAAVNKRFCGATCVVVLHVGFLIGFFLIVADVHHAYHEKQNRPNKSKKYVRVFHHIQLHVRTNAVKQKAQSAIAPK